MTFEDINEIWIVGVIVIIFMQSRNSKDGQTILFNIGHRVSVYEE